MTSNWEIQQSLIAIVVLLLMTHSLGALFSKYRQPFVTGEIIAGLILGPSVLGQLCPTLFTRVFDSTPRIGLGFNFIYNFGFMLLMFCSGLEINPTIEAREKKTVYSLGLGATLTTLLLSYVFFSLVDVSGFLGPQNNLSSLRLVMAVMAAVTSIPVISRIFVDLGLFQSAFARNILAIAVLDDFILYIALGVALLWNNTNATAGEHVGLLVKWSKDLPPLASLVAISLGQLSFVYVGIRLGRKLIRLLERGPLKFLAQKSATAFLLVILLLVTSAGMALGISAFLSAFAAGIIASALKKSNEPSSLELKQFSYGFFIPLYFGIVGFRINLIHDFSLAWLGILLLAFTLCKFGAVFAFTRLQKFELRKSLQYAITLSAKGGPGIVIATTALDAGVITAKLSNLMIIISILSSALVGSYLAHEKKMEKII